MIEQHVTSLELSKKLHEAGLDIETTFYWTPYMNGELLRWCVSTSRNWKPPSPFYDDVIDYPAPLATELLEVLPHHIYIKEHGDLDIMKMPDVTFLVGYMDCVNEAKWIERKEDELGLQFEGKLPNALALMWLYLKEHELL